jgi:sarcosine oxidase
MAATGHDVEVVVVGAGIAGAATSHALAADGRRVLLLEQFELGHARGSSHGASRIFRLAYADPELVSLAREALAGWRALEAECGEPLLVQTGSLDLGAIALEHAPGLEAAGVRCERLTGREVGARWPIAAAGDEPAVFQPDGGIARADRAHAAFLDGARTAGCEVREQTRVTGLTAVEGGVRVDLTAETISTGAVVVTAGAWAAGLLAPLGIDLEAAPTRETVAYFQLHDAAELPSVIDAAAPANGVGAGRRDRVSYGLAAPGVGLKAGLHHAGPEIDPDEAGVPDESVVRWAAEWVGRRYPEVDPSPLAVETCLYTNRPDERFLLERRGRVVVGAACSGHGFKFAPVVGRTLAGLARDALAGR